MRLGLEWESFEGARYLLEEPMCEDVKDMSANGHEDTVRGEGKRKTEVLEDG